MPTAANDNRIETIERKVHILMHHIEMMEGDVWGADGKRKQALLKLLRMARTRLTQLRTLH